MRDAREIPSLDGLRAIAVVFVILCHCMVPQLAGIPGIELVRDGSLGVSIFFIISGYLITHLLIKEQDKHGRINLSRFYVRRAFRIFPPFYVYLAVAAILKLYHPSLFNWASFASAATYIWNYNPHVDGWLLGHTWSLSLEEQFYLAWPAAMLFLSRRASLKLAGIVILLSPALRVGTYYLFPWMRGHVDMMLHTHVDAIMVGCFFALAQSLNYRPGLIARLTAPASAAAAMVYLLLLRPALHTHFRGQYELPLGMSVTALCCGIVVVFCVSRPRSLPGRLLNNPVLRHIGIISYSLYLWQQMFTGPDTKLFPLNLLFIVACAECSYWLIERPSFRWRDLVLARRKTADSAGANGASGPPVVGVVMPLASQVGGAEALFQSLLRSQPSQVQLACCFLEDGPLVAETRALGYQVDVIPTTHLKDVANYLASVRALRDWMRRRNVSLVFSWMLKAHLYSAPAALGLRIKTMWFQHGLSKRHWMDLVGAWCPADSVLCCSAFAKDKQDAHFPRRPSFVCHPGVLLPRQASDARVRARQALDLPEQAFVVGMVARLERWKGAHIFLEAAREVLAARPNTFFFLVGGPHALDPTYAREICSMAAQTGLGERFRMAGQRPAGEIPAWHASADLIVHPAIEPEPFGMAIVEAMASGRAVVASNIGGPAEIIVDGVSGSLIPPGDAALLARTIVRFHDDTRMRSAVAAQAVERARVFSMDAFVSRFEGLLSSTLNH